MPTIIPDSVFKQYQEIDVKHTFEEKVIFFAKLLQGVPYGGASKNEKSQAELAKTIKEYYDAIFNEHELHYDFSKLDCVTYVEVVLALAYIPANQASTIAEFKQQFESNLKSIRYMRGNDSFWERNHFQVRDWNHFNQDLFPDLTNSLTKPVTQATADINKIEWFLKLYAAKKFPSVSLDALRTRLIDQLQNNYPTTSVSTSINYISTLDVVNHANDPDFLNAWPNVSIVEIARPCWDLTKGAGTHLHVSHLGLCVKTEAGLQFMHATSVEPKKTVTVPLEDYMRKYIDHATIKGIHVLGVVDRMDAHKQHQLQLQGQPIIFNAQQASVSEAEEHNVDNATASESNVTAAATQLTL